MQVISVYKGIYNRKNLRKHKIPVFGSQIYSYELTCHPHIEEDQTKIVSFIKKQTIIWSRKTWEIWHLANFGENQEESEEAAKLSDKSSMFNKEFNDSKDPIIFACTKCDSTFKFEWRT